MCLTWYVQLGECRTDQIFGKIINGMASAFIQLEGKFDINLGWDFGIVFSFFFFACRTTLYFAFG